LQEILDSISGKELDRVFGRSIKRLMIVSTGDEAYISGRINHSSGYSCFNHDIRLAQRLADHTMTTSSCQFLQYGSMLKWNSDLNSNTLPAKLSR
jgi:hypothetical protein